MLHMVVRRGFVLAAAIIGTFILVLILFFSGLNGTFHHFPPSFVQFILLMVAVAANWTGFFVKVRGIVLTAAICYSVAAVVFLLNLFLLVLPIVFSYIGYYRMKPVEQMSPQQLHTTVEIMKYKELLEKGAITEEEYELKKKQLLGI